jgi:hypothetical protein
MGTVKAPQIAFMGNSLATGRPEPILLTTSSPIAEKSVDLRKSNRPGRVIRDLDVKPHAEFTLELELLPGKLSADRSPSRRGRMAPTRLDAESLNFEQRSSLKESASLKSFETIRINGFDGYRGSITGWF